VTATAPTSTPARLVVLYDRGCGLCQASVRTLARWDRAGSLEFVALQEAAASGRPALERAASHLPLDDALHVVDEATGRVWSAGDASLAIVDALPGGWLLRPWRNVSPWRAVIGAGYDLVARNRHTIGHHLGLHGPACEVLRA
jgi:predicted DCC family thiol-disulfide oxidoreductase YuxK